MIYLRSLKKVTVSQNPSVGVSLACVKINTRKSRLEWSLEASRGNFHAQYELSIAEPNRKKGTLQVDTTLLIPSRGKKIFFFLPWQKQSQ